MGFLEFIFYWILGGASLFCEIAQLKKAKLVYMCSYIITSSKSSKEQREVAIKKMPVGCLPQMLYMIYSFIGMFTFQWPIFSIILLLAMIPKSRIQNPKLGVLAYKIDSIICLVLIPFTILNAAYYRILVGNYMYEWIRTFSN